ncbi:MAG: hypothetical protein M3Y44_10505 [Actinomycetota bacterium]|nr:hypothetical protein [Actinomycetota bacterium]
MFDRAAARDFVDVDALAQRFTATELRDLARDVDAGFDIAALRAFFQHWIAELSLGEH